MNKFIYCIYPQAVIKTIKNTTFKFKQIVYF